MNQEKIGKFIFKCRKNKNMTQAELADILGVTDRAVSKWENGRGMPDYSLLKPLCTALDITINELLAGEKIKSSEYQKKSEENILNTIRYANKKTNRVVFIASFIIVLSFICLVTFVIVNRSWKDDKTPQDDMPGNGGVVRSLSAEYLSRLNDTIRIEVKISNDEEDIIKGKTTDKELIDEIIKKVATAKASGDAFLCDGAGTNLVFYDKMGAIIDSVLVWTHNLGSERILPNSLDKGGCFYFHLALDGRTLKEIIEEITGEKYYTIIDKTIECSTNFELIYEDKNYKYYFNCQRSKDVLIKFDTSGIEMTLKKALNEGYITIDELGGGYDLFVIKEK